MVYNKVFYYINDDDSYIFLSPIEKNFVQFFLLIIFFNILISIPYFYYNDFIYNMIYKNSNIIYFYNYLSKIEYIKYNKLLDEKCSICHNSNINIKLKCNHLYHFKCITKWYNIKNNCPLCRYNVFLYYNFNNLYDFIKFNLDLYFNIFISYYNFFFIFIFTLFYSFLYLFYFDIYNIEIIQLY